MTKGMKLNNWNFQRGWRVGFLGTISSVEEVWIISGTTHYYHIYYIHALLKGFLLVKLCSVCV